MFVGDGLEGNISETVFWILDTAAAHAEGSFWEEENCLLELCSRGYCVLVRHQGHTAGPVLLERTVVAGRRRGRGCIVKAGGREEQEEIKRP